MKLINYDFLNREPLSAVIVKRPVSNRFLDYVRGKLHVPLTVKEDVVSKKRRKRVAKVFVSRGGIRL